MRTFDDRQGTRLYDVRVVYAEPCGGEECERSKVVSTGNCLSRALQMVDGITRMIELEDMRDVGGSKALRAYMEPMDCARPWTDEIRAAYDRVMKQDADELSLDERREIAKGQFLYAQLAQLIGTKGADAVRDGTNEETPKLAFGGFGSV